MGTEYDVLRLQIQQIIARFEDIETRFREVEDITRQKSITPLRVANRQDGFESELLHLREAIETIQYYAHRHIDALPIEAGPARDVPYFPPGCPEQCWRRCECNQPKTDNDGNKNAEQKRPSARRIAAHEDDVI